MSDCTCILNKNIVIIISPTVSVLENEIYFSGRDTE